ncbi:MAG TPA: TerB family tellurite resistance protein [Deltaproteobacteria bacterium]|jgi:uncharacterized tellurite resistance protein B-like protein|nr:TerB family tellurite resistance protein [Deltaproteobacteria bacterium]HQI00732.1 TerB family tellurite resistance protein [Deltaproteobacteria bacterium]HQJ07582.1 TerB family tellurite resistance protein [Deltaproteobacteria bacterium]
MIDLIKRLLGVQDQGGAAGDEKSRHRSALVAACALLLEMAHIDGEFSEDERQLIVSILRNDYGLGPSEIDSVIEAAGQEVRESIDLWQFASIINQYYSEEEKVRIIEMIWKVVFSDGRLDKYEDYLVHNLADLLRLDHSQLIDAKLRIRKALRGETSGPGE